MRLNKLLFATGIIAFNKVLMLPRIVRGAQLLVSVQADDSGFIGEIPHGEKDHEESHSGGHALDPPFHMNGGEMLLLRYLAQQFQL